MIEILLPEDYAANAEIKKEYREAMELPIIKRVFATAEMIARSYNIQPSSSDAGAIGIAYGKASGMQFILDKMRTLDDAPTQPPVEESFLSDPTD